MITKAHITRRAAKDGVAAKTVERDYVLAHVIAGLAMLGDDTGLVFKGGTALRLCYFDDYRYSADLDFTLMSGSIDDGYASITAALDKTAGSIQGLRFTEDKPARIAYLGPLGRERSLKLDIAADELVLRTQEQRLLPRWSDLPKDTSVRVYTLVEIAGEKLRCVLQRLQCRDLYDLWLLFEEEGVDAVEAATCHTLARLSVASPASSVELAYCSSSVLADFRLLARIRKAVTFFGGRALYPFLIEQPVALDHSERESTIEERLDFDKGHILLRDSDPDNFG